MDNTETRRTRIERSVAYKLPIKELAGGKFVSPGGYDPNYVLTPLGLRVARARIMATVTNSFLSQDARYAFLVLDDGTGVIRVKAFQDTAVLARVKRGETVDVVGKVREYNGERYIVPELIRVVKDGNEETVRRLEVITFLKFWRATRSKVFELKKETADVEELKKKAEVAGIKGDDVEAVLETEKFEDEKGEVATAESDSENARLLVMKAIQELDEGEGVDYTKITQSVALPEAVVDAAIGELLSEGSAFEPKAGKIRAI